MGARRKRACDGLLPSPDDLYPVPMTVGQERLVEVLDDPDVDLVVVTGPAGTGKTWIAVRWALWALASGSVRRVVAIRPNVAVDDRDIGYLPGDANEKIAPWMQPILRHMADACGRDVPAKLIETGRLEIVPLAFVRGWTFSDSAVIVDEAQSTTPNSMLALLTRVGEGSRVIVCGDTDQTDSGTGGLAALIESLRRRVPAGVVHVALGPEDVVRSRLVRSIIESGVAADLRGETPLSGVLRTIRAGGATG